MMACALYHRSPCFLPLDLHHLIPKQRIRNHFGRKSWEAKTVVDDPRLWLQVCRKHHEAITVGAIHLTEEEIPARAWAAATDYGMSWSLERDLDGVAGRGELKEAA